GHTWPSHDSRQRPDSARCVSPFANWVNDGPRSGIERQIIGSIGPVYVELVAGLAQRDRRTWITGRVRGTARRPNLRTHTVRPGGELGPGHGLGAAQAALLSLAHSSGRPTRLRSRSGCVTGAWAARASK